MKHRQDWQNSEGRILTVNMIKEGSENKPALLILLNFYLEKSQKSNLSAKTNENGGKSHYEINVFSQIHDEAIQGDYEHERQGSN